LISLHSLLHLNELRLQELFHQNNNNNLCSHEHKNLNLSTFFFKKSHHGHGRMGTMGPALGAGLAGAALTGHLSPVSFCACY
jgi:hypothetical protein